MAFCINIAAEAHIPDVIEAMESGSSPPPPTVVVVVVVVGGMTTLSLVVVFFLMIVTGIFLLPDCILLVLLLLLLLFVGNDATIVALLLLLSLVTATFVEDSNWTPEPPLFLIKVGMAVGIETDCGTGTAVVDDDAESRDVAEGADRAHVKVPPAPPAALACCCGCDDSPT
jgi:hypothetical protein